MAKNKPVVTKIKDIAEDVYKSILKKKQPSLHMPLRSLSNVKYDPKEGYFELIDKKKERTLTASSVKTFAQTLKMMALSTELIKTEDIATKREAYYVSKNWEEAHIAVKISDCLYDSNRQEGIAHRPLSRGWSRLPR